MQQENFDDIAINEGIYMATILTGLRSNVIDNNTLQWHDEGEGERSITLGEIYQQLKAKGYDGTICVWQEAPLSGDIYLCGNHEEGKRVKHGTTRGYA